MVYYLYGFGIVGKQIHDVLPSLQIKVVTVHSLQVFDFLYVFHQSHLLFQFLQVHFHVPLFLDPDNGFPVQVIYFPVIGCL